VLPSPFAYVYWVTLGHCAATVTAEYRVSSRQVLSPNPSASAIDACCGPHHGYLLETALPAPPDAPPLPPVLLAPLPVLPAPPVLPVLPAPPPLLHAAMATDSTAARVAPMTRRPRRVLGLAWTGWLILIDAHFRCGCASSGRRARRGRCWWGRAPGGGDPG